MLIKVAERDVPVMGAYAKGQFFFVIADSQIPDIRVCSRYDEFVAVCELFAMRQRGERVKELFTELLRERTKPRKFVVGEHRFLVVAV